MGMEKLQNFENDGDKILFLIDHFCNGSKSDFAKICRVGPSTVTAWVSRSVIDAKKILIALPKVSAEWLLRGEGPMLKDAELSYNYDEQLPEAAEPIGHYGSLGTITIPESIIDDYRKQLAQKDAQIKQLLGIIAAKTNI